MNFKNNALPLGRRGTDVLLTYDQRGMQRDVCGVVVEGGKNPVWAPIVIGKIHCSTYSLDTNPLRLVGFTTEMFSMKINQKLYTQSSNFTLSAG